MRRIHPRPGGHIVEFSVGSAPDDGRSVELVATVALGSRLVAEKVVPRPVADPAVVHFRHWILEQDGTEPDQMSLLWQRRTGAPVRT